MSAIATDKVVPIGKPVYNVLHAESEIISEQDQHREDVADDDNENESHAHKHKHEHKQEQWESFDFQDFESMMWRKVIFLISY